MRSIIVVMSALLICTLKDSVGQAKNCGGSCQSFSCQSCPCGFSPSYTNVTEAVRSAACGLSPAVRRRQLWKCRQFECHVLQSSAQNVRCRSLANRSE